jgi:hypothetical protein
MKKYLAMVVLPLVLAGCKKKDDSGIPAPFTYAMAGRPSALSIPYGGTGTITINVIPTTSAVGVVSLSPKVSTPAVATGIAPAKGEVPFNPTVSFTSVDTNVSGYRSDNWGVFPMVVYGASFYGPDSLAINLTVNPPTDFMQVFPGTWLMSHQCSVGIVDDYNYPVTITLDSTAMPYGLVIYGFSYTNSVLKATVDPIAKTITLPSQLYGAFTYSGNGSFKIGTTKQSEIDMDYSITGAMAEYSCGGTLLK